MPEDNIMTDINVPTKTTLLRSEPNNSELYNMDKDEGKNARLIICIT